MVVQTIEDILKQSGNYDSSNDMSTVCFIFRKPQAAYFSIEKIFSEVASLLKEKTSITSFYLPHSKLSLPQFFYNLKAARKIKAEVFHVTGDVHYITLALPGDKTILTIHDCIFMQQSHGFKRLILKYLYLKWPIKHCSLITTISEKSRHDIIQYTGCSPKKVVVIPNPLDSRFYFSEKGFNENCPVVLFIGSTPNKNLERVIDALTGMHCLLDIVGRIPEHLQKKMTERNIHFRQSAGLSDQQLIDKYIACDLLLFPSTYEGFGLPIIEAQKVGRPVITSSISPMNEVAGNGALFVDPFSVDSIRSGLLTIISDGAVRNDLVRKGSANVQKYQAKTIANAYLNIYKQVGSL